MRFLYLVALVASWMGVLGLDRRFRLGVADSRLLRAIAFTVPLFLAFDVLGAARGWFWSNPALNSLIVSPGVPLEEPLLLAFLTLLAAAGYRLALRLLP
ncbi:MAG: lycopene cyclase domain-containing protein [Candidatus Dormibacteraeota bacterium]|nr:lycopene cyclase domain-containing protein [Candidatus Dormibacteraeota bacterium]